MSVLARVVKLVAGFVAAVIAVNYSATFFELKISLAWWSAYIHLRPSSISHHHLREAHTGEGAVILFEVQLFLLAPVLRSMAAASV